MGCTTDIVIVGGSSALVDLAHETLDHLERRWSRFLPDSDISRLNHAAGSPVHIDPATVVLLRAMVEGWRATGGAFDPTLLAPLVGLGYASSWHDRTALTDVPVGAMMRGNLDTLLVDPVGNVAIAPAGMCLDAGGIGKGLAADLVTQRLLDAGAAGALVSIGGDVAVRGIAPHAEGWLIGLGDPTASDDDVAEVGQLALLEGGVATSGTLRRRWPDGDGDVVHHLLDPKTGRPVHHAREIVAATVVAGSAGWAEVWTKALMIDGERALADLDAMGLAAAIAYDDATMIVNASWAAFDVPCSSAEQRSDVFGDEVEMVEV